MAEDNARQAEESGGSGLEVERKLDRPSRPRDQRGAVKVKDKPEDTRLPTPPPDPQCLPVARDRAGVTSRGPEEEEEDLATYLSELGTSPFEGHSFDYDTTPNSMTSAMGGDAIPFTEEAFEHLDRLCSLTEQILELRDRSSKYFRRVRGLERAKVQRNADRRLEVVLANDEEELLRDFTDEDTGFAESLLDAMLSNCRDAASTPRRAERLNVRSPSSSRQRSRSLALAEQNLAANLVERTTEAADKRGTFASRNATRNGGPKVSKWTRVKAAFKWERACTNDLADIAESCTSATASSMPTTRYLRIPDTITAGSWNAGPVLSPCTSEVSSPSTPIGRVSSASSSNEEMFDDSRKNIMNYSDRQLPLMKDDKKKEDPDRHARSFDRDTLITESIGSVESPSEANRSKPLIRIISDADATMHHAASESGRDLEVSPKRPTPTLTITIPSNEEEIRSLSSPESISPLPSSTQDSGGSSPQHPKMRQDASSPREFKRQYATIEETVTQAPKIQQDSKWNKVRRAFLTNATFSVPPSPIRAVAAQSFTNDDTRRARSCSESVEDLGKTVTGISSNYNNNNNNNNNNYSRERETRRDYQALREKFGAEFHRKLVEWERLKSARNARDGLPLNEERLAPEFRKKLQDWKRTKKGRRSGAAIEQQRVSRRRLTDWQLWRSSSSKPEFRCYNKNQNSIGSRGSCASIGSAGSFGSDGKQHLCEDFIKRMEAWRRMSEVACRSSERPKSPTIRVASDIIDETEFFALEKLLLLFGQRIGKERRESDARQLNDCFDGDSRFMATSRNVNCGNEVLIRTSVGSYRFEGISREFTRKLYDWEKYRGISPRSSTFRLLGPGYTPFTKEATLTESANTTGKNRAFHWTLKRSKSDGSVFEGNLRDQSLTMRRSTSLQSLISAHKLEDDARMNLPVSNNSQGIKDHSEDTAVEDSEPEAMIVDIEDVIEETASPLTGVQPHQTPVYSVAASETTSIAIPLGTVTSSHEPSPVFLVEAGDNENCESWNGRKWIGPETHSSENSPSPERFSLSEDWRKRTTLLEEDKPSWESPNSCEEENQESRGWTEKKTHYLNLDFDDSVKSDRSIGWNRDTWDESCDEANKDSIALELPLIPTYESKNDTKQESSLENNNSESANFANNFEITSTIWNAEELMDSPHTWTKEMNETTKIEDLTNESSNNEQMSDTEDLQDDKNNQEKKEKIILSTDFCTYQLARTISSSNRRDSTEILSKLSNSNLDDNKDMSEYRDFNIENEASAYYENCSSPELQTDVDRHYEILTFKTDTCSNTINNHLYEPIDCHEEVRGSSYDNRNNCVKGSSLSTAMERSSLSETPKSLLINSTVRTVPITVSRDNEARCLEKILINEETLNKIIVPTANAENGIKSTEGIRNRFASVDRPDEIENRPNDCNSSTRITTRDNQVECIKKDSSSPKNIFIKTKRMIFSPFRRSEDRTSSRKESDGSIDVRLRRSSKSKSKSRSTSPKLSRQDALLRVSLSLPWPLRSTSKDSEITFEAESKRSSGSKTEDAMTVQQKNSPCEENSLNNKEFNDQPTKEKSLSSIEVNQEKIHHSDSKFMSAPINMYSFGTTVTRISERSDRSRLTSIEQDRCSQTQNAEDRYKVKCNQENFEEKSLLRDEERFNQKQGERKQAEIECGQRQDEARQQDENHAKCDAVPSDLMHKLRILSDAAARREGRTMITESLSGPESRSSRIRRAKESFLSRRGGPFCRSMESTDPWRRSTVTSTQISSSEASKANATIPVESEERENAESRAEMIAQEEIASLNEDKVDECQEKDPAIEADVRSESLVKSASAGMINVDPNTFDQLVTTDRGCESLPRTIAKRRDSSGPLAKIVSKLRLSRLIRARNVDGGGMSTISTLCRQSLLIDMRGDPENRRSNRLESEKDSIVKDKDLSDESS